VNAAAPAHAGAPGAVSARTALRRATRLEAIDALRGAIMIVMALDHVRDFIHGAAMSSSPTDLARTTPVLFFTRWITHFCAPGFMFTAGLGAFLWWQRGPSTSSGQGRTRKELSIFLATRGLWLIVLELTVMRLAYDFDLSLSHPTFLLVLWVLGGCMIGLAALVWLPERLLIALSLVVIALHNTLDGVRAARFGALAPLWNLLHQPGPVGVAGTIVIVGYPIVPWIAVMTLGFCAGRIFLMDPELRQRRLIAMGSAITAAFLVLRALNVYGDPVPWSPQPVPGFTVLSFLNTTKYPPSLAFLLMTLGPLLIALALFDRARPALVHPLIVYGRVPLFYFVTHFYAAHLVAALLAYVRYGSPALQFMVGPVPSMGGSPKLFPPDFGYPLWVAYMVWALVVLGLYPACRRFAQMKAAGHSWWLRYL
jgi:uncharacterized membrane protein